MNSDFYKIFEKVKRISGVEQKPRESEESTILRGLEMMEENFRKGKAESEFIRSANLTDYHEEWALLMHNSTDCIGYMWLLAPLPTVTDIP